MNPVPPSSDREAILRRAIIRAKPEYCVWPETEQERHRLSVPKEQDCLIRQAVLRSLFGSEVDTEEGLNEVMKEFNDEQYLLLNSTPLPFQGLGENDFFLNEWLADGVTLLDFETLGDYARDDHKFQEQARKEEDPAYAIRPYQGDLQPCWARLNIDGEFHYATLRIRFLRQGRTRRCSIPTLLQRLSGYRRRPADLASNLVVPFWPLLPFEKYLLSEMFRRFQERGSLRKEAVALCE